MPKSRNNNKNHKKRLSNFKATKKREQEALKKEMIDKYVKMQKENLEKQQEHTSIQEVQGPEINIDDLNQVENQIEGTIVEDVDIEITDENIL